MKTVQGDLRKMDSVYDHTLVDESHEVHYFMELGGEDLFLNSLLGKELSLEYSHRIHCIHCGRLTRTSFAQGYCYPCFISLPQTDDCVLRPELCRAHEGISRDMAWSEEHCLQEHVVYLALSPELKVGVTRRSQVPTRWIDQGAVKAISLARTPNRFLAGTVEVALKDHFKDKTNWRSMLRGDPEEKTDLVAEKEHAATLLPDDLKQYFDEDDFIAGIRYPVKAYPGKVNALNLDKTDTFRGILTGIRGQYWIFDDGNVLNIRKHGGYNINLRY